MKNLILLPVAFYVYYIFFLMMISFKVRKQAIKQKQMNFSYFRTFSNSEVPDQVIIAGRHFDNQFQAPLLFFFACLVTLIVSPNNVLLNIFAWSFVMSRITHSFIHLGSNNILNRAKIYALGWLILLAMWAYLVFMACF